MLAPNLNHPIVDQLCRTPFATDLTAQQCATLASIMTMKRLARGHVLLREGERDDSVHIVVSGTLAVTKRAGDTDEIISFIEPGSLAGGMGFIDGQCHTATLRAMGDAEVLSLSRDAIESLITTEPRLVYKVMTAVIRAAHNIVRNMNDQYMQLTHYITRQHGRH